MCNVKLMHVTSSTQHFEYLHSILSEYRVSHLYLIFLYSHLHLCSLLIILIDDCVHVNLLKGHTLSTIHIAVGDEWHLRKTNWCGEAAEILDDEVK